MADVVLCARAGRPPLSSVIKMAAMTGLALVGAVPMTAEDQERSRLMPFVHQLLSSELVRRVIDHWTPPEPPLTADAAGGADEKCPDVALDSATSGLWAPPEGSGLSSNGTDSEAVAGGRPRRVGSALHERLVAQATSVTEAELAAAAAGGRSGPPPDLVTCHQQQPLVTDFRGAVDREPTAPQLQLRLERLQAVRRSARQEPPADLGDRSPAPPPGPDWRSSRLRLHREDAAEEADDEDSEDSEQEGGRGGGRSQRRGSVGRELGAVADRLDAQHSLGLQTQRQTANQKTPEGSPPVPLGRPAGGIASYTAVTACGLAALGFFVRQMSSSDG